MEDPAAASHQNVSLITWLLGIVVAILGWLGQDVWRRVNQHEKNHVSRTELETFMIGIRQDAQNRHTENIASLKVFMDTTREDSQGKHVENIVRLERIEDRVNQIGPTSTRKRRSRSKKT